MKTKKAMTMERIIYIVFWIILFIVGLGAIVYLFKRFGAGV